MCRSYYHRKIFHFLVSASVLVASNGCKKSISNDASNLKWIQFRLISSDPNIRAVSLTAEAIHDDSVHYASQYNLFQNVNTSDTFVMRLSAYPGQSFLNGRFRTILRIQHINKVYSPVLAANGVYVDGDPYIIGWHYVRQWQLKEPQTIRSASDTIYYIRMQTDTSKYIETVF
jgi:hypothetical protein